MMMSWTEILYIIYSPIFNYLWVCFNVCMAPFRSLRHAHRPTVFACSGPVGPFELDEHRWRTCLAGAAARAAITPLPRSSLYLYPLDVSHNASGNSVSSPHTTTSSTTSTPLESTALSDTKLPQPHTSSSPAVITKLTLIIKIISYKSDTLTISPSACTRLVYIIHNISA